MWLRTNFGLNDFLNIKKIWKKVINIWFSVIQILLFFLNVLSCWILIKICFSLDSLSLAASKRTESKSPRRCLKFSSENLSSNSCFSSDDEFAELAPLDEDSNSCPTRIPLDPAGSKETQEFPNEEWR